MSFELLSPYLSVRCEGEEQVWGGDREGDQGRDQDRDREDSGSWNESGSGGGIEDYVRTN